MAVRSTATLIARSSTLWRRAKSPRRLGVARAFSYSAKGKTMKKCPDATQDPQLNARNQDRTRKKFHYGPADPMQSNDAFWASLGAHWGLSPQLASLRRCGNCGAYDVSREMVRCGGAAPDGTVGYCRGHHFSCSFLRTCSTWSPGGPTTD